MDSIPMQLSVKQAAEVFNIPENTLRAYIHRRIIPHRRVRGRIYFVTEVLEKWLAGFDVDAQEQDNDS